MALGYSESWGVSADVDVASLANDARSVCTAITSVDQRSDVRAARLGLEVSQRNVEAAGLGYSPTIDLVSDLSYTTQPQVVRPVQWSVGAVLSVPIFDGGLLAAQRRTNLAGRQVAEQQLTEATRRAELEAIQARRAIEVAQANFEVSSQARDISREAARLSRIAFVHGTGTSFDLVESARRQRLTEIDVTIREFEVVRANITALLALSNCDI
jgi:outer membrane protein TolC